MTIISVRRRPPPTCRQKCCSLCSIRYCGGVVIFVVFITAAIGLEIQLQRLLVPQATMVSQEPYWCGEWTPYGNLGNESYDPSYKESVDPTIPPCSKSNVGMQYRGKQDLLFCKPDLNAYNRTSAYLALDMRFMDKTRAEYSIVSQSRSFAGLWIETLPLLCKYTVGTWEVALVLDASYDDSLQVLHHIFTSPMCLRSSLVRARVFVQPFPGILETSSLNLAMTASRPSHFYVYVPPSVVIQEKGWNRDLARVVLEHRDVYSVSGQCGTSLRQSARDELEYSLGRCSPEAQVDFVDDVERIDTEHAAYVTETNTRGPVLWRADALRELGYLNEANHYELDNDELNRRAFHLRGWFPAYKYVQSFVVDLDELYAEYELEAETWFDRHLWKYFRKKSKGKKNVKTSDLTVVHLPETMQLAVSNYRRFRSKGNKVVCSMPDNVEDTTYFHPYHEQAEKRMLTVEFDFFDPLPPLPEMI